LYMKGRYSLSYREIEVYWTEKSRQNFENFASYY
jgi:hypothetical protein